MCRILREVIGSGHATGRRHTVSEPLIFAVHQQSRLFALPHGCPRLPDLDASVVEAGK